jgi:hypothetical protein
VNAGSYFFINFISRKGLRIYQLKYGREVITTYILRKKLIRTEFRFEKSVIYLLI